MGSIALNFKKQFALFKQTMICDNRDLSSASLKTLTVFAFFFGFMILHMDYDASAKGLRALEMMFAINILLLPLTCLALFLPVIMEERKNQSMGLLMMTGLEAVGYLMGRCGSRFIQLIMLICLQLPFAIISVAMGGITIDMVLYSYLYLFSYSLLLTGIFIFCSLFFSNFFKGLLFAGAICFFLVIFNYTLIDYRNSHYGIDHYLEKAFEAIFEVGMNNSRNWGTAGMDSYWTFISSYIIFGILFTALTYFNFARKAMEIRIFDFMGKTKEVTDSLLPKRFTKRERFRTSNPIFTKDYYYIMHGRFLTILQTLIIFAVMAYVYLDSQSYYSGYNSYHLRYAMEAGIAMSFFSLLFISWYAGNRIWYEEIEAMTFNSLKITPRPVSELFFQKIKVAVRCQLPAMVSMGCLIFFYMLYRGFRDRELTVGFFFIMMIPAAFYVTLYLSLFLKKMRYLVSAGACVFIFILEIFIIESNRRNYEPVFIILGIMEGVLALWLNFLCNGRISEKYLD